ncbi:MAG TPA: M56 family metallopeptidase, partial [Candidatus Sumerlaeota bacterium]|nr:M56 family metallopeptidase [Candidatus Sumerlaeota bacterium]
MFNWPSIFRMPNEWIAGVVLDAALKGGILLVALWLILRLVLRSAPASIRYTVCVLVASGVLFLPLVSALMPQWEIPCPRIAAIGLSGEVSRAVEPTPPASAPEEEETGPQPMAPPLQSPAHASLPTEQGTPTANPPVETTVPSTPAPGADEKADGQNRVLGNVESPSFAVLKPESQTVRGQSAPPASPAPQVARVSWDFRALRSQIASTLMGLFGFWALVALFSFCPWVLGLLALYWLLNRSQRVEAGPWFEELETLSHSLAVKPPRLFKTPHCLAPMAGGFLRAFIIMPSNARAWSRDKIRNVLIHELGHIRRHDDLTYLPVRVMAALHWFNPLAWSLLKMLRFERERACDDFVLSQGIASCDYANHLLEIVKDASVSTHPAMLAAAPMATPRRLEKRILAILDDKINRKGLTMRNLITVTLATAAATLCLGAATVAETLTEPASWPRVATTSEVKTDPAPSVALTGNARDEIALYYKAAPQEVRDFILLTESQFGGRNWLAENAFSQMDAAAREKEIQQCVTTLAEKPYSRDLYPTLARAGVLRDKRLLPGLLKTAAYDQPTNYNCRPKWMAVAALARMGEESAVPVLVPLVDFGNKNVQMWSRAALLRLTGQTFDQDKKAWGAWWNARNKEPKLTEADLKPWSMATAVPPPPRPTPASHPLPTIAPPAVPSSNLTANAQEEIERYYKAAPKEVTDFILLTERQFRWPAENALDALDAQTREKDVAACLATLDQTPYSRQLCPALYKASILRDKRLLPGLLKTAAYSTPDGRYDCRPKWMAIAALARMGGETQNDPAATTAAPQTGTEERLTLDNPEDEKTVRDCKIRLIRIIPGASPEAELAVHTASKAETQQINLKQQGSRTVGDFEILCEEIKVGGDKAGGSV